MQATFLSEPDSEQLAQRSHIADLKWEGSDVVEITGTVADIYRALPVFGRYPYRSGGEDNRYKDEIRREPQRIDEDQLPIGTVGKTYALIQHRDVLASVYRALKLLGVDCADLESELLMSEYGERIQWSCTIPKSTFDPGDGEPLIVRVNCLNSVDMTTVLEVSLAWFRLVCSNGMMFGLGDSRLRKRHIQSLDPEDIADYIGEQFQAVEGEKKAFSEMIKHPLTLDTAAGWVDEIVAKRWGPHAAARVWHIIAEGVDGEVQPSKDRRPAHQLTLKSARAVPGAPKPTKTLYHAGQALSWIAGTRRNIEERIEYMCAIPTLMEPLLSDRH